MRNERKALSLRLYCVAALFVVFGALAGMFAGGMLRAKAQQEAGEARTVVFMLSSGGLPKASMEPILIIEQGKYQKPIAGDSDDAEIARFAAEYYRKGRKYRVLFGGGEAGSLTVERSTKDQECARTGAEAVLQTQAKLNSNVMALATNSDALGHKQGSRRAPTAKERAAAVSLARDAYRQKGVTASLLPTMQTINLTATDLNGDGKAELIGSFVVKKTRGGEARYLLFLLAEPQGDGYRAGLTQYQQITNQDVMGGLSLDEIVKGGVHTERLVDQLDLDGDGAAEVITITNGFEGVGYTFYKKEKGQWRKFFESGGYRCAF
jgi:hypothetical protein